jgi:hypothetical protein
VVGFFGHLNGKVGSSFVIMNQILILSQALSERLNN